MVLDDDQRALRDTALRFAQEQLKPDDQKHERTERLDRAPELAGFGIIAPDTPERYGGLEASSLTTSILRADPLDINVSHMPRSASLLGKIVRDHAPPAIVEEWLPRTIRGPSVIALGIKEARGNSDAAKLATRARRKPAFQHR